MKKIIILALALIALVGCSKAPENTDETHIKLGMMGSDSVVWKRVAELAAEEGIIIEIVAFSDYTQPNAALQAGEIDINAFQHFVYLENEVETLGYDIVPIAKTSIAPLGLYSKNITSLDQLKDGDKISIPNDVTNGGRALQLLQANGLIKLNDAKFPTPKDIVENPKNFEIIELAAATIPGTLQDVAIAAINSGIAVDAGLIPTEAAIVLEDVTISQDNPYVNLIAARSEDKDSPVLKRIIELYQTDEIKELTIKDSKGASIPVW
ncbi:MetQ/NlpA family ABC transporter substrate-binding protein [Erysipelothrix sp. HDW6C]|uniref:MetQ/NlpA family ABC transporter substrate-binding protein n=1 Tax=Erysipelothrix sp. HDW6C TaxID=2714930 RepID=UPI00140AAF6C|nr:MetQ/NlpA family ABC transporter substrate-binding protein [Erysipelothrix sp. HDW6C]QIK69485.1 MetQ/NlpA family ABC transporter substrate-binding protein [Erysipelothrix sp. HDW6C]